MNSKIVCIIVLAAGLSSLVALATEQPSSIKWGEVTNNFQMSISLKDGEKEVKTNQPVILLIRYRNTSTNEVFRIFRDALVESDLGMSFIVVLPSGKEVLMPPPPSPGGSGGSGTIPQNQVVSIEFNLDYRYKLNEIGVYQITAKKLIESPNSHKIFTVVSNPLSVPVVPGKWVPELAKKSPIGF